MRVFSSLSRDPFRLHHYTGLAAERITFDPFHNTYIKLEQKVGNAFHDGAVLKGMMEQQRKICHYKLDKMYFSVDKAV